MAIHPEVGRMESSSQENAPRSEDAIRKQMLLDFCAALEANGIAYVILSGYKDYPDHIDSDVDFMVSEADFQRLPAFISKPGLVSGARLVQMLRHETSACYYVLAQQIGENVVYLHPDSAASYRRRGRLWLRAGQVLSSRRKAPAGFWIPAAAVEFEYYFVKRVDKGLVEERHLDQFARLLTEDPLGCRAVLGRLLHADMLHPVARAIEQQNTHWFAHNIGPLRRMLAANLPNESVLERLLGRAREWRRWIRRLAIPTGMVIAVLGPDGSGKTTVIEHIERELAPAFRRVRRYHLRPHFGVKSDGEAVTNPHSQLPRGHFASMAKIGLFLIDYWLGWVRDVYPAKVRSTLVIFDRYYHDMLVDPVRYRLPPRSFVPRLLAGLVPSPDIWLVLHAAPESLVARKGEITLEAATLLTARYRELARLPRAFPVDTGHSKADTQTHALAVLLDFLAMRTAARLSTER